MPSRPEGRDRKSRGERPDWKERGPRRDDRPGMRIPPPGQRLRNVRMVIEYDGTRFKGWQVQANARTVAGALQKALGEVIGEPVRIVGAGRTDEGVHAEGQVANFLTRFSHPLDGLMRAVNDALPEDVAVAAIADVGPQFHARHSASSRVYRYHVAKRRSPFLIRKAWLMQKKVSVPRMIEATEKIVGFHDFVAFTDKRLLGEASTKVEITYAGWKEQPGQLVFRIAGSHFLPRMVRRLVGCLVRVGTGELKVAEFERLLQAGDGETGQWTAPSMGLVLEHVEYTAEALAVSRGERMHPLAQEALDALGDEGELPADFEEEGADETPHDEEADESE